MHPAPDSHSGELPDAIPMMVLSECTLFPGCLLPLFIFEPRYREMLAYALEHDRMFCIGAARPGIDVETSPDPVCRISTAGLVRACVTHGDGTSHLVLLGLDRIRVTGWKQERPFRIAEIEPVPPENHHSDTARHLADEVVELAGRLAEGSQPIAEQLQEHLAALDDTSAVADIIAHNFVTEPNERQTILEAADVAERLHLINQLLQRRLED